MEAAWNRPCSRAFTPARPCSNSPSMDSLVSTSWLAENLAAGDLVVIDASAHLPDAGRDPAAEFAAAHIPGARFLDLASFFDPDSATPAAVPNAEQCATRMDQLGIANGQRVVVYDDSYVKTAARAWFILRMHGVVELAILDGGLGKWKAEGHPLESGTDCPSCEGFVASRGPAPLRDKAQVLANIDSRNEQLVDARGAKRFTGEEGDFRPNIASGHIPGSRNLPFDKVMNADGTYRQPEEIRAAFEAIGVDLDQPIVTTCGGGVTAAVLLFALHLAGKKDVALYDGSWSEWGADPDLPTELGEGA